MILRTPLVRAGAVSFILVGLPFPAQADPVVITSGSIQTRLSLGAAVIDLQGPEFSARGAFVDTFRSPLMERLQGEASGPTVHLGGTFLPFLDRRVATAVVDGVSYPELFLVFASATLWTPTVTLTHLGPELIEVPFTFRAVLRGFVDSSPFGEEEVFTRTLLGLGTASAQFTGTGTSYFVESESLRYDFAPIPEPGTILLVGGAMGAGALRQWRRRHHRGPTPREPAA